MSSTTNYLVTGANRGLGLAFVSIYLSRPNSTIIAAVRDPSHPSTKALSSLPKASSTNLVIIKIDSVSITDAATAAEELRLRHNITNLDIVIANAGIAKTYPLAAEADPKDVLEHFQVNAIGVLVLFQAVLPFLKEAKNPKFVTISSSAGSISAMELAPVPNSAYGPSKTAVNYITRKIHFENSWLVVFPVHPGFVQTDMGNQGAQAFGLERAEITISESVDGIVKIIDNATREETSGRFLNYDGAVNQW